MSRWTGKTAERGYGTGHQRERERRLAAYRPGDLCAHGGEPMWWWPLEFARRYLDLPHTADRTGYLPGLACARHNRADGAARGNKAGPLRGRAKALTLAAGKPAWPRPWRHARRW